MERERVCSNSILDFVRVYGANLKQNRRHCSFIYEVKISLSLNKYMKWNLIPSRTLLAATSCHHILFLFLGSLAIESLHKQITLQASHFILFVNDFSSCRIGERTPTQIMVLSMSSVKMTDFSTNKTKYSVVPDPFS